MVFKRRTGKLKYLPEVTAFASVMLVIMITYLFVFLPQIVRSERGISADLPKTNYPSSLPNANKFDAIEIAIFKDGTVVFGSDRVMPNSLPQRIKEAVAAGAEKKVYIKADARARAGSVNEVVDAIRKAGIEDIAFLTEEKRHYPAARKTD